MPPKKKVIRTVRKAKPKTPTPQPAAVEPSVPAEAPAPERETRAPETPATPQPDSSPKPSETPASEAPAVEAPAAEAPAAEETPAAASAASAAASAAAAALETPLAADEPSSATTAASQEAALEPLPSEAAGAKPGVKTVTRVRKVIKKKIVRKLVPKQSPAAIAAAAAPSKEDEKADQEDAAAAAAKGDEKVAPLPEEESPNELAAAENPSLDAPQEVEVMEPAAEMELEKGGDDAEPTAVGDEEEGMPERRRRRKTEIFVGGLDRDAKEEDIRNVFEKAGEIVEVRMMMDGQSGKNKGYAFVRYADAGMAKKAVTEFGKVEVCGKLCGASALEGNDTIFLGNIDKKWKKEDIIKLLQGNGIEKIDTVTVVADPNNSVLNRGFAFLELETNRDAHLAFKKLQKKDIFGKGLNIKVAWAEPLNDPDEEEMKKVKSVYAEGISSSWDEEKVRGYFKKFGEIERIVLARNIKSAKRKDFAFVNYSTREAALSCIESFDKEELTDNGSKVNVKVSLAKPVQKGKQNKGAKPSNKDSIKEKPKTVQRDTKVNVSSSKGKFLKQGHTAGGDSKTSTNSGYLHFPRGQETWKQGQISYARGSTMYEYANPLYFTGKRAYSSLGEDTLYSDVRAYPRARLDSSLPTAGLSYGTLSHGMSGSSLPYSQHQGVGYGTGARYGSVAADLTYSSQRQRAPPPHGRGYMYSR